MAERLYGLIGEFADSESAVALARRLKSEGVTRFEVYSPLPIEAMDSLVEPGPRIWLALTMFVAIWVGLLLGFFLQYDIAAVLYPINIGGRPLDSWPAFIPTTWEIGALTIVYVGFLAFLIACRLPLLYHPIFDAPGFERASQDRILLCVEAADRRFEAGWLAAAFRDEGAIQVREVPL